MKQKFRFERVSSSEAGAGLIKRVTDYVLGILKVPTVIDNNLLIIGAAGPGVSEASASLCIQGIESGNGLLAITSSTTAYIKMFQAASRQGRAGEFYLTGDDRYEDVPLDKVITQGGIGVELFNLQGLSTEDRDAKVSGFIARTSAALRVVTKEQCRQVVVAFNFEGMGHTLSDADLKSIKGICDRGARVLVTGQLAKKSIDVLCQIGLELLEGIQEENLFLTTVEPCQLIYKSETVIKPYHVELPKSEQQIQIAPANKKRLKVPEVA